MAAKVFDAALKKTGVKAKSYDADGNEVQVDVLYCVV
jgi:hypothetical protein